MKNCLLLFLLIALSINVKSQTLTPIGTSSQYGFDVYPVFLKNGNDFGTYIVKHIKTPEAIGSNLKRDIVIGIDIDSAGRASMKSIYPNNLPDVEEAFKDVIAQSPAWQPATLNGKAVKSFWSGNFFVELKKDDASMYVERFPRARQPKTTGDVIFNAVEINPDYPGGISAFNSFMSRNKKYPEAARLNRVSGRVFVQFVIEKDGSLTDLVVIRDPGYGLGYEAIRLLCIGPKWLPGVQNGQKVRVQYIMPFDFTHPR